MTPGAEVWRFDPVSLRDVAVDSQALTDRLPGAPALERVWILRMLCRLEEAAREGEELLASASNRFRPLLVLAEVYQWQYRWHDAALLHEEALRRAQTPSREATVREQIGRRLFDEGRYWSAAAEFEWARDLYRSGGAVEARVRMCEQALLRAREQDSCDR